MDMNHQHRTFPPPTQRHPRMTEPLSLAERMERQEKAMAELRQDTTRRFAEARAEVKAAIDDVREDIHKEFTSVHSKLDAINSGIAKSKGRKLLG